MLAECGLRDCLGTGLRVQHAPLLPDCHFGLCKLSRWTGDRAKVDGHLATAKTMYREMSMNFWLEKAKPR
jgi:hypothetical protein